MIVFDSKSDYSVNVMLGENKIGTIADSCCETFVRLKGSFSYSVRVKYEPHKGGYMAKKMVYDGKPTYHYRDKIYSIFKYIYESEKLQIYLKKRDIIITRSQIEENRYLSVLKEFEKEIK